MLRYLLTGKGMLTYSASLIAASVKILQESATPDVQISFAPGSFKDGQIGQLEAEPGLTGGPWQMRPLSRGYVEAKTNRPGDAPAINPRYLTEESDRRAIIGGLKFVRRIFAGPGAGALCRRGEAARQRRCRATTNCSITPSATATRSITQAAPA